MREEENKRMYEAWNIKVGKTHTSKSKSLRDCPHLSALNLSSPMDSYDIQFIENYLRVKGYAVHHDSSCEEKKTLVWSYDQDNEEFICEDYLTYKNNWNGKGLVINQHLNNVRKSRVYY